MGCTPNGGHTDGAPQFEIVQGRIVPWKQAVGIAVIAVLTSTLAGLVPALHAARLRIPDAIAYE